MVGEKVYRDGIELEKGVTLTQDFLIKNEELFAQYANYFTTYPDLFLDLVRPDGSGFNLFFYQRIILRALMRYVDVFITAPRAAAKSFTTILALILQCVFFPGTTRFIAAPGQGQSAQIAKQKIIEIYRNFPILRREVIGGDIHEVPGNFGRDYVELKFRNGSRFIITPPIESTRGLRAHGGLIDEVRRNSIKK